MVDGALVLVAFIWGANASVVKTSLIGWDPMAWNGLRFILGSALMGGMLIWRERQWRLRRELIGPLVMLGLVGNTLYQTFFIQGVALTTASNTALILGTSPVVVTVWSAISGHERVSRHLWVGVAASMLGLVLVVLGKSGGITAGIQTLPGDLLIIACMLSWAAYTVYVRRVQSKAPSPLYVTGWAMLIGALVLCVITLPNILAQDFHTVPPGSWLGMVYSAGLGLVVAYSLYGWGVERVGSTRASIYINLVPVIAAAVAWGVLGERWTLTQWVGALLVLGGVSFDRLRSLRTPKK